MFIKDPLKENLTPIGEDEAGNIIGIDPSARIGLTQVLAGPGNGKVVMIAQMVASDIIHGRGGLLIDLYGDLVDIVLKHIPAERQSKTVVFDLQAGDLESNLNRFESEIHLSEMNADDKKFLLCRFHRKELGDELVKAFGRELVKRFFHIVGETDLKNRVLYFDGASLFMDEEILKMVLESKKFGLSSLVSESSLSAFEPGIEESLAKETDNLLTYSLEPADADFVAEHFNLGVSSHDIQTLEKFHFIYWLKGEDPKRAKGIYPIIFPEV